MARNSLRGKYALVARLMATGAGLALTVWGQSASEDPESFRIEITGAAWILNTGGTIQANRSPIDLVTDLGVGQQRPTFYGRFVFKPARKHRIILEGTPFDIQGYNVITRSVSYRGYTYNINQTLESSAAMTYFFGGYQYDLVSGPRGHFGLSAGAAYLSANGTIHGVESGVVESKSEVVGLPLAGAEFRIFPISHRRIFEVDGEVRGMGFGSYGHYIEAQGNAGIGIGPVTFQAGYRSVNADLHENSNGGSGIAARLTGPIFSMQWRW